MAFTYGFYNSLNHDRIYDAIEMSSIFDGLITDGIYATIGDRMMVNPSLEDNTVIVKNGRAWFNHTWNYNDSDMVLTGPDANVLYNRWDAIVLDVDATTPKRENSIIWVEGTAASSPVKPTMIKSGDHNQYPLAYLYRPSNNNAIISSNIINCIGSDECPYCEGLLSDTKNIAPVEINDTASRAYAYGEYILWHDFLYKVTTPIIQNGTIIAKPEAGYNVERTTMSTELYNSFVFDTVPTPNSSHAVTSDGIYKNTAGKKVNLANYNGAEIFNNYSNNTATANYAHAEGSGNTASGTYSHAEGSGNTASGTYSHAEGYSTDATGHEGSHAEGENTLASGYHSHAEGSQTTSYGINSHAEGYGGTASGSASHVEGGRTEGGSFNLAEGYAAHAEGSSTKAISSSSHAEGRSTTASGDCSHAEGQGNTASGTRSHAEGQDNTASGARSHVEGDGTTASGNFSHAEGSDTKAKGGASHAEGSGTTASGAYSHAEGYNTDATANYAHAEGRSTTASGDCSHAEGQGNTASGDYSHAEGFFTKAAGTCQHVSGHYNTASTAGSSSGTSGQAIIVGNGTSSATSNAFRVTFSGNVYGLAAFHSSGADYAEYFEWLDGNPNSEDRVGYFVTLDGDKIKIAGKDDYILGIVSGHPSIVGNGDEDWQHRWLKDDFGRRYTEEFEAEISDGDNIKKEICTRWIQNPKYDAEHEYVERKDRAEWDTIAMLGAIEVRDDGTCEVNGYCTAMDGGIATKANIGYRVIGRVSDNIIRVIMR